jgi:hypothetical protein
LVLVGSEDGAGVDFPPPLSFFFGFCFLSPVGSADDVGDVEVRVGGVWFCG